MIYTYIYNIRNAVQYSLKKTFTFWKTVPDGFFLRTPDVLRPRLSMSSRMCSPDGLAPWGPLEHTRDVVEHPRDVSVVLRDVVVHPRDVSAVLKDVVVHPKDVVLQPRDVSVHPRDVVVHPRDVVVHVRDVVEHPRDVVVYTQEMLLYT